MSKSSINVCRFQNVLFCYRLNQITASVHAILLQMLMNQKATTFALLSLLFDVESGGLLNVFIEHGTKAVGRKF